MKVVRKKSPSKSPGSKVYPCIVKHLDSGDVVLAIENRFSDEHGEIAGRGIVLEAGGVRSKPSRVGKIEDGFIPFTSSKWAVLEDEFIISS